MYFWEHNSLRALEFAREVAHRPRHSGQKIKSPAVVGAVVDLGLCLNLLDSRFIELVDLAYEELVQSSVSAGTDLPKNTGGFDLLSRRLDCAVLRMLHQMRFEASKQPFDTVRSAFIEGDAVYPNAGFFRKTHIQLCVRNRACIKGYFRPLNRFGKLPSFH